MHPTPKTAPGRHLHGVSGRSVEARLEEAVGLAKAIRLDVVGAEIAGITRPRPSSLLGSGTVENLAELIGENDIGLVVIDGIVGSIVSVIPVIGCTVQSIQL